MKLSLLSRQIHLDFHTGPAVPDVGRDFDARQFAQTMLRAHVNSVTVFAKCHHGHLYYNTKRPERHPGLKRGLDLLRRQVDALHAVGIRAPIYISVQCDEYAANTHPEWVARKASSAQVKGADGVFQPGWQIMDMASPYQDFLAEQTAEVLKVFKPVDGIFFDMCWDQPSTTKYFIASLRRVGLNPESEADRDAHSKQIAVDYMRRFFQMVKASSRDATVFFNSRPLHNLKTDIEFLTHTEIEALATGGWGYMFFPKNVRYVRTFPKPYLGMTARFHKSWADFGGLKPVAALEYETSQMMAHGAGCSIGDQLHPRGVLDKGAYELIGHAYGRVAEREPWLEGARSVAQIGLFQLPASTTGTDEGATRMLTQLRHQFDVVSEASDFARYELLILPDAIPVSASLAKRLRVYLKQGGKLLATGTSGLSADGMKVLLPELRIKPAGLSPYTATYFRFNGGDHVMYDRGVRVTSQHTISRIVEPYFERTWDHFSSHFQTPGDKLTRYAAATVCENVGYISYPIFSAFATHGNYPYRLLVKEVLDRLLPEPLLRLDAPTSTEATVMQQGRRTIVHLLNYCPEHRTKTIDIVEDSVPLYSVPVSLKFVKRPKFVYLAPSREALIFDVRGNRVNVVVPEVRGHAMVVFE
ncbi:MAG: hypothetical protein PCFJNLEI_03979 [Verrucomicrobiae bacterium]|nr:hypothetical protein [Verrucomicrobiae bacterium]